MPLSRLIEGRELAFREPELAGAQQAPHKIWTKNQSPTNTSAGTSKNTGRNRIGIRMTMRANGNSRI
jgi:hypothetical protein